MNLISSDKDVFFVFREQLKNSLEIKRSAKREKSVEKENFDQLKKRNAKAGSANQLLEVNQIANN